ncbi:hypothetical protein [Pseudotenacibaculum haliotis]|uniref:General secretion pathway protein n=1 Tax=Pseudotenacibaculum haliotis TaxID=1862138 RepID=A0ABW5LW63_9FLAO
MNSKQKNRALIFGFIILMLVAYQFSFKKTFELKASIQKLSAEKKLLSNANERIHYLQQHNAHLDSILRSNNVSADRSFEQNLFQKLEKLRKEYKTTIVSFDQPHEYVSEEATMVSYTIEVKGDFRNLMLFASSLEKQRMGKFSSVEFLKKKNYKTRRNELICKIILQKLSK